MGNRLATVDVGRKYGGLCQFWGGRTGSASNTMWPEHNVAGPESYLLAKFHLDPSNRLATIHQRYRQTDRTDRTTVIECRVNRVLGDRL